MTESEKLLPCPFCGSNDLNFIYDETEAYNFIQKSHKVICINGHQGAECRTRDSAIEDWNRRLDHSKQISKEVTK